MTVHPINKTLRENAPRKMTIHDAVNNLTNIDQLAIWVYLTHLPSCGISPEKQVREHFGIGCQKYSKALKGLREAGLVWRELGRGKNGRIMGNALCWDQNGGRSDDDS